MKHPLKECSLEKKMNRKLEENERNHSERNENMTKYAKNPLFGLFTKV